MSDAAAWLLEWAGVGMLVVFPLGFLMLAIDYVRHWRTL